jgi:hypothetical protein
MRHAGVHRKPAQATLNFLQYRCKGLICVINNNSLKLRTWASGNRERPRTEGEDKIRNDEQFEIAEFDGPGCTCSEHGIAFLTYVYTMVHGAPPSRFPEHAVPELVVAHNWLVSQ